ncbi:Cytochrome P450 [Penicillium expansum]|uniref:Cytochrome P450 n=1 Tax=Penicillium expansum TaxID=27334 RepID=A0A0A2J1M7_PENEN|nr:Cytochrome P450 [Penicillium expansum]KGO48671.1 Cytochrome P450 [Penicillium expansum]KGO57214.1 Cytochrome P450 [Penicillium expansum]KGO68647.1 Cytochrome P450 [Penicillium expansum]
MRVPLLDQLAMAQEQFGVMRGAMASLRLSRTDLALLTLRRIWHDEVVLTIRSLLETYENVAEQFGVLRGAMSSLRLTRWQLFMLTLRQLFHNMPSFVKYSLFAVYPNTPFIIAYSGFEYVVYPSSSFDEVKRVSVRKASMLEFFTHVFFHGWRFLGSDTSTLLKTIGVDLTRAVPVRVQARQEDTQLAFERAIGPCPEWKSVSLYWTIQELVAATNASGLVGPELGNDPRWVRAVQHFPMVTALAVYISNAVPRLVRPIVTTFIFLPAWGYYIYLKMLLKPMAKADWEEYENANEKQKKEILRATPDKKFPITAWLMSRYRPEELSLSQITHDLIVATFESTPSTAGTMFFILAELVSRPELVNELRDEVDEVLSNGLLPQTTLTELRKMDSVMRESSRVNPFSLLVLFRRLLTNVKLSIGPELPAGSLLCVDAHHIHNDEDLWEDPDTFDPMRFLKLRERDGVDSRHQFTSLGKDSPGWGDGTQACPGRVFAGNTIKIILTHLLDKYEIQLPPGAEKPKRHSMPNGSMAPDLFARIMIRERRR